MGNTESETQSLSAITKLDVNSVTEPSVAIKKTNKSQSESNLKMNIKKEAEVSSHSTSEHSFHYSDIDLINDFIDTLDDNEHNAEEEDNDTTDMNSTASNDHDFDITLNNDDADSECMVDINQLFMWDFDDKQHKKHDSSHHCEYYKSLLSNIILHAFMDRNNSYCTDDTQMKYIQHICSDIGWIIIDYLDINIAPTLVMEHNSNYTFFKYKSIVNKIRNIICRMPPIRNKTYIDMKPFIYIGSDALKLKHKQSAMTQKYGTKQQSVYCSKASFSFPIRYNVIQCTNSLNHYFVDQNILDLYKYIFDVEAGINMDQNPVLLIVSSQTPIFTVEAMTKFAFERMYIDRLCILDKNALLMSLFCGTVNDDDINKGTGIMIDISGDICCITPLVDFEVHQNKMILSTFHCAQRMNDDISRKINKNEFHLHVKCKIAASQQEYEEMLISSKNKLDLLLFKNGESLFNGLHSRSHKHRKQYHRYDFDEFMDKISDTDYDIKRNSKSKQNTKGLHRLIMDVIFQFEDEEIRRKLLQNILIYDSDKYGICTKENARNIEQRLYDELAPYATVMECKEKVKIHCLSPSNMAIYYASHLSECKEFQSYWIRSNEYQQNAENISSLCKDKWRITSFVSDAFNELINEKFYESLLFQSTSYRCKSVSLSPLF